MPAYEIVVREIQTLLDGEEVRPHKAMVLAESLNPIKAGGSKFNWRITEIDVESGDRGLEIYDSGPIPTDLIDFGSTILSAVRWEQQQEED